MSEAHEATVRIGEVLGGKYEVVRLIGKGGMGTVVEARHLELGEPVAIKILHPRYLDNPEAVTRFQQEARAAVQIRGEHSARLIDVGTAPSGAPFLVMELLIGEDLASLGARGPLPAAEATLYILQACEGMAEVHAHGIVHRDLKPGNLFLATAPDGSPLVKVLDFGIAKNVTRDPAIGMLTMTLVALGTPLYMAPEQIRSSRTVDARADVWSLGAILYELLAGRPAFGGNTVAHITAQVLEAEPAPLQGVPAALDAAVRRALAKEADRRWVDVAAFAAAIGPFAGEAGVASAARTSRILSLGVFASDTPLTSSLGPEEGPGTRRVQRRPRATIAVAVALGLAAATGGAFAARPAEPGRLVARTGLGSAALVRFAVASTAAHYASPTAIDAGAAPSATPVVAEPSPARAAPLPAGPGSAAAAGAPGAAAAVGSPRRIPAPPRAARRRRRLRSARLAEVTAMVRKLSLPMHGKLLDLVAPPTVEVMRARLGGRASAATSATAAGDVVRVGDGSPPRAGVVLASDGVVVDVYVEHGTVRRTRAGDVHPWLLEPPGEMRDVIRDVRVFANLAEGQAVRFAVDGGGTALGTLVEKCRWGGLVQRADGVVVGIGFRRVQPAPPPVPDV